MKKNTLYAFTGVLAVCTLLTLNSCKKKADGIVGKWKVTAATFDPPVTISGTTYTDAYAMIWADACDQDNTIEFKEGNQEIEDEGATKCNSNDPQTVTNTYSFSGSTITIYGPSDTAVISNVTVDEGYLKGVITGDLGGGTTATIKVTLSRQ